MHRLTLILFVFVFLVSGCVATTAEEPAVPEAESDQATTENSLATAVATATTKTNVAPAIEAPILEEDIEMETPESDDSQEAQISEPVTVDLSQLTPAPVEDGEPVEMPAPGIPDPTAKLVQDVVVDLSQRLNVDISEIELVEVKEVTWRDSSLGCPQPGMNYLQVLTPGRQIILEAQGKQYYYHTSGTARFIYCEKGNVVEPIDSGEPVNPDA